MLVGQKKANFMFNILAEFYDKINPKIYTKEMRARLLREIEGERILDVGVGTGYTTGTFEKAVGIDISLKMLRRARYKGKLILADCMHAPFKKEVFDTIISAGSLYYLPEPEKAVKIFYTLLKKNGVLLTITPSLKILKIFVHIFSFGDLKKMYENAGFQLEIIEKMRGIAYFCKGRKV